MVAWATSRTRIQAGGHPALRGLAPTLFWPSRATTFTFANGNIVLRDDGLLPKASNTSRRCTRWRALRFARQQWSGMRTSSYVSVLSSDSGGVNVCERNRVQLLVGTTEGHRASAEGEQWPETLLALVPLARQPGGSGVTGGCAPTPTKARAVARDAARAGAPHASSAWERCVHRLHDRNDLKLWRHCALRAPTSNQHSLR